MEETAVAVIDQPTQGMEVYNEAQFSTGLEDVARITPTRLIMVQNTTREPRGARPGQFLDDVSGLAFDKLTVVPLQVRQERVLFPPGADLDAEPICRSDNGITPSKFANHAQSLRCSTCPHSQWNDGKKSACAQKFTMLVIPKDTGMIDYMPRYLTVGGAGISEFRKIMSVILQQVKIGEAAGKKMDLYDFYFTVGAERASNSRGTYYVMRFDKVTKVENINEFGPYFDMFVTAAAQQRMQEAAQAQVARAEVEANQAVDEVLDAEIVEEV